MDQTETNKDTTTSLDPSGAPTDDQAHLDSDQGAAIAQRLIAPAISMGLTWAARKAMNAAYEKRNGTEPPTASDNNVPIGKVLAWAALTAVVTTAIDTVVNRVVAKQLPETDS